MAKSKKSHSKRKGNQKANRAANGESSRSTQQSPAKAYAPVKNEKPLILRILVVAICAVMVLGLVVGAVLTV